MSDRLGPAFFARDVNEVAEDLIGCRIVNGAVSGRIVETEAYHQDEPACHAYAGITDRTWVLFGPPGRAYVYLSYGIHQLFNLVTCPEGEGAAVLVRAIEPIEGIEEMRRRRGRPDRELCSGPGKLTIALGIGAGDNDRDLGSGRLGIWPRPGSDPVPEVTSGPRIGITKAVELPWRYCERDSPWLSAPAG